MDPAATQMLKSMTDYVGSLQRFSAHTDSALEDLIESAGGHMKLVLDAGHLNRS